MSDFDITVEAAPAVDITVEPPAKLVASSQDSEVAVSVTTVASPQIQALLAVPLEAAVSASGPPGPPGPQGPAGATGAQGPQGDTGDTGPQGIAGSTGATGAQGPQGEEGPQGPDGATGPAGPGVAIGGTTGQVLKKASGTDYDTEWGDETAGGTDHGALTGLLDDDHTQYHNDARGDARYSLLAHTHDHLVPLAEDAHAVAAPLTDYPDGISEMGISDASAWSAIGFGPGNIITYRSGAYGWQAIYDRWGFHASRVWDVDDDNWLVQTSSDNGWLQYSQLGHGHNAADITSGTLDDARLPAGIARDSEVAAGYAPLLHAASHTNGTDDIQSATSGQKGLMTLAYASKLDGIEAGATADQTAAEILTAVKTVDGTGSGLDADLLDGQSSAAFAAAGAAPTAHAASHTNGTDDIQNATAAQKGLATAAQITKLDGIETGATADQTAAEILTAVKTVDGTGSGLDADTVDGVDSASLVQTSRTISTTAPLTGGGDLSANRTLAVSAASDTAAGVVELATDAEVQTGTDTARAITPANLTARTPTETRAGVIELATQAETNTGTDDVRAVTPLKLKTNVDLHITDASAAHAASAISFSPTGSVAATDVQAAIAEVASEASGYRTLRVVSGSDVVNATTSFADVTGLTFAVTSGVHYKFYAIIDFTTNATTTGIRFSMNGPTLTRGSWRISLPPTTGAAPYAPGFLQQVAFDTGTATTGLTAVSPNMAIIEGFMICSASGTAAVRFASEVAVAAGATVKIGSSLEYWSV